MLVDSYISRLWGRNDLGLYSLNAYFSSEIKLHKIFLSPLAVILVPINPFTQGLNTVI